ncbi:hypothetical protein BSKO_11002 [Bryopsis sp. KO-2023]|nr:hypothetical protein BSKO_11002 [Bryopsis sp. KO-2023]
MTATAACDFGRRLQTPSPSHPVFRVNRKGRFRHPKALVCQGTGYGLADTRTIFESIPAEAGVGGAGGKSTYDALKAADGVWERMKNMDGQSSSREKSNFVVEKPEPLKEAIGFDAIVCGGTLGIFVACALQIRGLKVAVVERGPLRGRKQEWNISRKELAELGEIGILKPEELEECINIEWQDVRAGFHNGTDMWTSDVLNLGISPERLIKKCVAQFVKAGGVVFERTSVGSVSIHENGVALDMASANESVRLTTRILLDCMGNFSPIVQQIRQGQKPDGACLVVGTLAEGFTDNSYSDLICTTTPAKAPGTRGNLQYFWEAFPAGSGSSDRTTYMFAYMSVSKSQPTLEDMFADYWKLMPKYQGVDLSSLTFKRPMFGVFPTFKDSPIRPGFNRVLQIGDASGLQSPLSFGGFGSMLRHLNRLTCGLEEALEVGALDRGSLGLLNAYNPGLSGSWMMQKAMSVREDTPPDFINTLLSNNFQAMGNLGDWVIKPFLQDVPQFGPLALTLMSQMVTRPLFLPAIIQNVGIDAVIEWFPHFGNLCLYGWLYILTAPLRPVTRFLPARDGYRFRRMVDIWEYGSGNDFKL